MLVMFSGQSRSIRSGGKIPIPDPQGNGAYQFVEYGTHLTCRANILSDGRISLEVDSEVREIVDRDMLQVGGKTIPAVKSLSFQSAGVVGDEQALVIAGVVQERTETVEVSDPESEGGKRMEQRLDEVELLVVLRCEPFDKG